VRHMVPDAKHQMLTHHSQARHFVLNFVFLSMVLRLYEMASRFLAMVSQNSQLKRFGQFNDLFVVL